MFALPLRRLRFLFFTPAGHYRLPEWLLRPAHWFLATNLLLLALALFSHPPASPLLLVSAAGVFLLALSGALAIARIHSRRLSRRLRFLFWPVLFLLMLLPMALVGTYIGILTEPYFFSSKRLNRSLRGSNHLAFRPPRGIRTDPVPAGLFLGALVLLVSSRLVRTTPTPRQDKYHPDNWDIAHWENVEVLGDDHNDASAEFYLDRASSAIRITFTTPVLDYYLERLIQFDEGVHWWFPERPPPFYSEKPFRSSCWGGVPRYAPRDLYFVDPTGPAPQYHPSGGYHPLWVNRQAALMLGKQPLPETRFGFRRPLWFSPAPADAPPVRFRFIPPDSVRRQQRLLDRLDRNESYREGVERILKRFRSRETTMTPMQHYLYHPDAQGERDHRHMRIRQHLDEQDELDRLADASREAGDEQQEYLFFCSYDDWEDELETFDEEIKEDMNALVLLDRHPLPYSAYELRPFVPYNIPPNHGA